MIELDAEKEIRAAKETLAQISSEPKNILRKSLTTVTDDDSPETGSSRSKNYTRTSSLPLPHRRTNLSLPAIGDDEEEDVCVEEVDEDEAAEDLFSNEPISKTSKKSNFRENSSPPIISEAETLSPRRPTTGKSSRKRTTTNRPPQPPVGKGTKSPRKLSYQDQNATIDLTSKHQLKKSCPSPPPLSTSVDVSTSIDLNLTRLSRVHRFIQTDMYSTEYGGLVNQVADLTTELEEKEQVIAALKNENLVWIPVIISR